MYLVYNTPTGIVSSSPGNVSEVFLTKIRLEANELIYTQTFGGLSNTFALDLNVNVQGVFILISYYPGLLPSPTSAAWGGPFGSTSNFILLA
jgi:hypothetical protein